MGHKSPKVVDKLDKMTDRTIFVSSGEGRQDNGGGNTVRPLKI